MGGFNPYWGPVTTVLVLSIPPLTEYYIHESRCGLSHALHQREHHERAEMEREVAEPNIAGDASGAFPHSTIELADEPGGEQVVDAAHVRANVDPAAAEMRQEAFQREPPCRRGVWPPSSITRSISDTGRAKSRQKLRLVADAYMHVVALVSAASPPRCRCRRSGTHRSTPPAHNRLSCSMAGASEASFGRSGSDQARA